MNRFASRAGLLLLIVSAALLAGFKQADEPQQATWVWQAERIVSEPEQLLSFAKTNQIDVMFLHIHPDVPDSAYRQFIRQAAKEGIEVHALAGDPTWALPEYRGRMLDFLQKIQRYNAQAAEDERFRESTWTLSRMCSRNGKRTRMRSFMRGWTTLTSSSRPDGRKAASNSAWTSRYGSTDTPEPTRRMLPWRKRS